MDLAAILVNSLWSALFATGWRLFFPLRLGRWCQVSAVDSSLAWARDLLMGWGASQNLATFLAAALVLFIAVRFVRRPGVSPIVMVAGVIPLGAAGVLLRAIVGFLQVLSLKGEGLSAPVALISNPSILFTTTCAIAMGAWTGYFIGQSVSRDQAI